MPSSAATLTVNLTAVQSNWRLLRDLHARKNIAAVVKANAYGLGVAPIAKALAEAGCKQFFVATLEEGIELRAVLPKAPIAVFNGLLKGEEKEFAAHKLTPVLNDPGQVERFEKLRVASCELQAILHIDTGMTRLGLSESELTNCQLPAATCQLLMSHLACASEPAHPKNQEQLERFRAALTRFPGVPASLTNSSGLFLPEAFHFDLGRPGCGIYGIHPSDQKNPLRHVATLSAPIIQLRHLDRDEAVGYGATVIAPKGAKIAIVALGYADGYSRVLSNKGRAWIGGHEVALFGRVSMDLVALDVSAVPEKALAAGRAEFIHEGYTVNDLAEDGGTIGYEVFTRIGTRVKRLYIDG